MSCTDERGALLCVLKPMSAESDAAILEHEVTLCDGRGGTPGSEPIVYVVGKDEETNYG